MRSPQEARGPVRVETGVGEPITMPSGRFYPPGTRIKIDAPAYQAAVTLDGYVSGIAAGTFLDKATGSKDLGFGLDIVDFLLEPERPDAVVAKDQYHFNDKYHGAIAKRYVEGPQICTQAKKLPAKVGQGKDFASVQLHYRWNVAFEPRAKAGSIWQQTLVFPNEGRFFLAADRVTTVSESPEMFMRLDFPGHIRHTKGNEFKQIYLSYHNPQYLPSSEFLDDFTPDAKFLYQRKPGQIPERFIRAYQVTKPDGSPGPWLGGLALNPADVYQAWCHQRGYICLIQEIGGRPTKPGDTFGACYLIGWFDSVDEMNRVYDRYKGWSGIELQGPADKPTGYKLVKTAELTPVSV